MQMTDEVRQAMQTLRDNATNDFERHRIDVLERDLTNPPPRVEVVDESHQRFLGIPFRKRKGGHYWMPGLSIYRAVWMYYRGDLSPNLIIHHIDENKDNNNIENLTAMTMSDHMHIHKKNGFGHDTERLFFCQRCGVSFVTTATQALYCPNCREVIQKEKARLSDEEKQSRLEETTLHKAARRAETMAKHIRTCPVCGKIFFHNPSKRKGQINRITCSDECSQIAQDKAHQARRVDRTRICKVCGKPFQYKHKCQTTCSWECGHIATAQAVRENAPNRRGEQVERVVSKCEMCGKEIRHLITQHPRFCSQDCVHKYMAQVNTKEVHASPKEIRTCIVCGKEFECTKTAAKQWCSPECRKKTLEIPCPVCGKMFVPCHPSSTTCSLSCAATYRHSQRCNK